MLASLTVSKQGDRKRMGTWTKGVKALLTDLTAEICKGDKIYTKFVYSISNM